ncbi:hypothetical protein ACWC9X_09200 [Streptomyces asoensis]
MDLGDIQEMADELALARPGEKKTKRLVVSHNAEARLWKALEIAGL